MIVPLWRNLQCLSAGIKSTSFFTFFLTYCKDIANLLFWLLWACHATFTQSDTIILSKTFIFICWQKINSIPYAFMEILERYTNSFSVLWECLVTFTQNDSINFQKSSLFVSMQKLNLSFTFFLRYYSLPNPGIWLADRSLAHNSIILPDMVVK